MYYSLSTFLLVLFISSGSSEFPDDINRCKFGDADCIKASFNAIMKDKINGDSNINLRNLNPLILKHMGIKDNGIDFNFEEISLTGLETSVATEIKGFNKDLVGPHEIHFTNEFITGTGKYDLKGTLLNLPLVSSGTSVIKFMKLTATITFKGKPEMKNGKEYMKTEDFKLVFDLEDANFAIKDSVKDDEFSTKMNEILNKNWRALFDELKDVSYEKLGNEYQKVIDKIFESYPYEEFFLQD